MALSPPPLIQLFWFRILTISALFMMYVFDCNAVAVLLIVQSVESTLPASNMRYCACYLLPSRATQTCDQSLTCGHT